MADQVCVDCGKTYEQHELTRSDTAPVPKVPCLLLRAHFRAKPEERRKVVQYRARDRDAFITSARLETLGGHDHVGIWVHHQKSGELVVNAGDGVFLCEKLGLVPGEPN